MGIVGWGVSMGSKLTINKAIVIAKGTLRAIDGLSDLQNSNCAIVTPEVSKFKGGSIVDVNIDKWATEVAIAPTYGLYIAGKQVHALNCDKINSKNFLGVTIAEGGECRYDKEKNTLFMKDVTIAAGDNQSAVMNYIDKLIIKVEGENRWSATNRSAFFNRGEVAGISGEEGKGKLEVTSRDSAAVFVHKTTVVDYIDFTATGKWGVLGKDPTDRICNFSLHTAKGKLTATSTEEAVSAIMNVWSFNDDNVLYVEPRRAICIYESTVGALIYTKDPNKGKKIKVFEFDRKYSLKIGRGLQVDAENHNKLVADPNFPTSGITVGNEGHLRYDPTTKTLFMKDVKINSSSTTIIDDAIDSYVDGLTIKLEGENTLDVKSVGIACAASTQITGDGSLTIKSGEKGIVIGDNPEYNPTTISNITLDVQAPEGFLYYNITTAKCICNNIKATVHDGSLKNCDCTFKGCKIVSAEGASPIEIDRIRVESLSFNPAELIRYVGDAPEAEPIPEVTPTEAGNKRMRWATDNEEVAKVVDGQLIIGKKGTAHLTAAATDGSNTKAPLTVHVRYRMKWVKLYKGTEEVSELTIAAGQAVTLTAKIAPADVPGGVEWEFQESEFAVKDKTTEKATFTALKVGDYTITARAAGNSDVTAKVTVKVLSSVESITLHQKGKTEEVGETVTFEVGESKTFEVKQLPEGVFPLPVSWSATVGGKPTEDVTVTDGVVTVKKWVEGCTVTAQVKVSESKTLKKEFTLTVLKPAPKEIKLEPKELTLAAGETKEVTISFVGDAPFDEGVTIEPATSDYITIKQEGNKLSITGKKPTTEAVTLTVTSTRSATVKESCTLTVTTVVPTAITIAAKDKAFTLKKGESKEITLGFTPAEYVNNEVVVTVAPEGALSATAKNGKLTLKADKPFDKEKTVKVTVTSKVAPTVANSCTVTLNPEKYTPKPDAVEDAVLASLSVAPNPFTAQLRILNPEGIVGRYELVNQMGAVLRSGVLEGDALLVDTEALPAGLYFVRLTAQGGA
ncbi:MAG: T9SS type A sorting domain-containing protein, partial [Bacteroides sp.]